MFSLPRASLSALRSTTILGRRTLTSLNPNLYTATATSTGSRANGTSGTVEGNLSTLMGMPKEMGGHEGPLGGHSNPEQLFGMGYSTCFLSALGASHGILHPKMAALPPTTTVRALVSIGKDATAKQNGYLLGVQLEVPTKPLKEAGLDAEQIEKLLEMASGMCPYSRAIKGNVEVEVRAVEE